MLWKPAFFGVKPELVLKGGMIAYAQMGDANASIPTPQPVFAAADVRRVRPGADVEQPDLRLPGGAGRAASSERYGLQRPVVAVQRCRKIGKKDLPRNTRRRTFASIPTPIGCGPTASC